MIGTDASTWLDLREGRLSGVQAFSQRRLYARGDLDLAVAISFASDDVSVLLGDGAGGFAAATKFTVGTAPYSVAVGDLDGDGFLDLAVANLVSGNVSVLLGDGAGGFAAAIRGRRNGSRIWNADERHADRTSWSSARTARHTGRIAETRDRQSHEESHSSSDKKVQDRRAAGAGLQLSEPGEPSSHQGNDARAAGNLPAADRRQARARGQCA